MDSAQRLALIKSVKLPNELRNLVNQSVALLGQVIQRELGKKSFERIESLRSSMATLRDTSNEKAFSQLKKSYQNLESLSQKERHEIARAFTLMLELMNACENAYRSYRLEFKNSKEQASAERPHSITYVLTAHPTEARSPQNISIFHEIQNLLIEILSKIEEQGRSEFDLRNENSLLHFLEIAWRSPIVRDRSPKVKDEAEHIYSMLFREQVLCNMTDEAVAQVPISISSWVGGDKDGHPGVDEKTFVQSLTLSRQNIIKLISSYIDDVQNTLKLFKSPELQKLLATLERSLKPLRQIRAGDIKKVEAFKKFIVTINFKYQGNVGYLHPQLIRINKLIETFPGLVVPLELRESSEVLMTPANKRSKLAIFKMLQTLEKISRGGDPTFYARGFIISMTESADHLRTAAQYQIAIFGEVLLPIIPLFEEATSLKNSEQIMSEVLKDPLISKSARNHWDGIIEMMVGYSDSSKEAGVLASRLAIAEALPKLEKVCEKAQFTPTFFHGSGGSIDRGGGSIEDQTAWWPKSALRNYKVTVQGEMVERSFATPAIARRQVETIVESATHGLSKTFKGGNQPAVDQFALEITKQYRKTITEPDFLKMVEAATPYSYLNVLKIGSRPSKRSTGLTVKGLRAIPWILCWTQTRVLFPTWWGVGQAWANSTDSQKKSLKKAFRDFPVFTSYINALGFTLAKIELSVWHMYLEQSHLKPQEIIESYNLFKQEFERTKQCYFEICEQKDLLWFRPWLGDSINLRSAMIHPLNLLQILAKKEKDPQLLRVTVTGVSSGMLTTG